MTDFERMEFIEDSHISEEAKTKGRFYQMGVRGDDDEPVGIWLRRFTVDDVDFRSLRVEVLKAMKLDTKDAEELTHEQSSEIMYRTFFRGSVVSFENVISRDHGPLECNEDNFSGWMKEQPYRFTPMAIFASGVERFTNKADAAKN